MHAAAIAVVVTLLVASVQATSCDSFNDAVDGSYWEEVANCSACAVYPGCGFCLSTLQCLAGDSYGPGDGSPCSDWIIDSTVCPGASRMKCSSWIVRLVAVSGGYSCCGMRRGPTKIAVGHSRFFSACANGRSTTVGLSVLASLGRLCRFGPTKHASVVTLMCSAGSGASANFCDFFVFFPLLLERVVVAQSCRRAASTAPTVQVALCIQSVHGVRLKTSV